VTSPDEGFVQAPAPRVDVLGVAVCGQTLDEAVATIEGWIDSGTRTYVCLNDVHTIVQAHRHADLRAIYNRAGMTCCDGMPLVWACRLAGHAEAERVYGPDLMLALCAAAPRSGRRHYFYGGTDAVLERLRAELTKRYPGLAVAGVSAPPFRSLNGDEDRAEVERINAAAADIVWIGLGAPKQDRWMAEHLGRVSAPVMIGVGAAFDFLSGGKRQAPLWMRRTGLEWLHRLATEPRRLWRRYVWVVPAFLILAAAQLATAPFAKRRSAREDS